MKILMTAASASALALCACGSSPQANFAENPGFYGLYVAASNIYVDAPVTVKNAGTGQSYDIPVKHIGSGDTGYLAAALPAGHYTLESYRPMGSKSVPLNTPNGYFDVQANCFNYGGVYDFELGNDGLPTYQNTSRLKDIEKLPSEYRQQALGHDICSAAMGQPNDRISASDVNGQIALQ